MRRSDKNQYKYEVVKRIEEVLLITGFSQAKEMRDELTSKYGTK